MGLLERIFGNTAEKELKRLDPIVKKIESFDKAMQGLTDEELRAKTDEFKKRLAEGETLDDLLPEAYAVVREATDRVLHTKHFRVQLVGGVVLHQGRIAEMRTGEGKTQVCLLPAYLNALEGKGVHVVTVNDYLANRDAEWMGQVHRFLGLTVGCILNDMSPEQRKEAYSCDITYGTNNEFGFDYLRDNMVVYKEKMVQRGLYYAIIDEVDSVLIDEARTPLIISGRSAKSTSLYQQADLLAERLQKGRKIGDTSKLAQLMQEEVQEEGDFIVDEKEHSCVLTAQGVEKAERYFKLKNLSDPENAEIVHHINVALKARYLMFRDKDYVVKDDQIVIVDEFTGRLMPGRRYSDGLHQAIEAKERVEVKRESKTLATITFQNYFNKYEKKAGMTGTAKTEENEFQDIYGMDVVEIPTNRPVARKDHPDMVFKTKKEKYAAAIEDIKESYAKGQPVLVGTITIEDSELVSHLLKREGIPHDVLNAKNHEREANIVAQAGQKGMITIATNMAGRGTDIKLGEGVKELGGLKIIGTERHESRRIDNQLRGRAGRQGDPGESRFYISMEDDLMRIFGGERMKGMLDKLRLPEGQPISDKTLSSAIERSQKRVEENNFGIRKRLLEYDQINNSQREIIYDQRRQVLEGKDMRETMMKMLEDVVHSYVAEATKGSEFSRDWNLNELNDGLRRVVPFPQPIAIPEEEADKIPAADFEKRILDGAVRLYEKKEEEFGDQAREIERVMMLRSVDQHWTEHIDLMDQMRQTVGMQSYAQKNPLDEYRMISYNMFEELSTAIKEDALKMVYHVHLVKNEEVERKEVSKDISTNRGNDTSAVKKPTRRVGAKIMPNDLCPCGSGLKYKFCHGKKA